MENIDGLEKFGLDRREALVYVKLLEIGVSTANGISKETRILRQTVYEVLDKLKEKGLISYVIKGGIKYFEATDPTRLKNILDEKRKVIDLILPQLKKIQQPTLLKPKVEVYEGVEGLKSIYNDILKTSPKELFEYGNSRSFIELMKLYFVDNYIKKRVKNKIKLKLITERNEEIEKLYGTDKKMYRETRYNSLMKQIQTAGYVYENKIVMLSLIKNPVGIIVENSDFVKTQKLFFNQLWKQSKN